MVIAGVIAFCVLILILAFVFPKLSRHPERGGQKVIGAPTKATQPRAGQARQVAVEAVQQGPERREQERQRRAARPRQDAALSTFARLSASTSSA